MARPFVLLHFPRNLSLALSLSLSLLLSPVLVVFEALSRAELNLLTHMAPLAPPLRQFPCLTSKIRPARSFPSVVFQTRVSPLFFIFFSSSSSTACYLFIFSPLLFFSRADFFSVENFSTVSFNLLPSVSILYPHPFDSSLPQYRPILQAISGSKRLPVLRQKLFSTMKEGKKKKRKKN